MVLRFFYLKKNLPIMQFITSLWHGTRRMVGQKKVPAARDIYEFSTRNNISQVHGSNTRASYFSRFRRNYLSIVNRVLKVEQS